MFLIYSTELRTHTHILDLVESDNVNGLNIVFMLGDFLFQKICADLKVKVKVIY